MSDAVTVVWDEALLGYTMGGEHPLHPVRLDLTMRLADSLGVLAGVGARRLAAVHLRPPRPGGRRRSGGPEAGAVEPARRRR